MRTILRWTSIALFLALSLFMFWFGCVYASVSDMLWFHGAAVPAEVHDAVLPLYLALMNLIGGSSIAFAVVSAYIALVPLRRGAPGAAAVLALSFVVAFAVAAITAEDLAAATGAPTSWRIMGVLLAITTLALIAHVLGRRAAPRRIPANA